MNENTADDDRKAHDKMRENSYGGQLPPHMAGWSKFTDTREGREYTVTQEGSDGTRAVLPEPKVTFPDEEEHRPSMPRKEAVITIDMGKGPIDYSNEFDEPVVEVGGAAYGKDWIMTTGMRLENERQILNAETTSLARELQAIRPHIFANLNPYFRAELISSLDRAIVKLLSYGTSPLVPDRSSIFDVSVPTSDNNNHPLPNVNG